MELEKMKRRQILKIGVTSGVALTGLGTAAARRRSHDGPAGQESGEFEVSESSSQEVNKVRQSSPYQDITGDLPRRANLFNFDRAKTVRKKGEGDSYKLAVPIQGAESFDPVSATEGLHAHVNSDIDEVDIVARYEGLADERSDSGPAAAQNLESASTISASTSPQGGKRSEP
ncbi:hypothetical protein [Halarchaeum grantii]|nr:hypothetical protein [Halarchaeum grantii]